MLKTLLFVFAACVLAFSIYLGIWVMFIGGIVQIAGAVQAVPVATMPLALGIAKVVFCEVPMAIAWIFFWLVVSAVLIGK